jgi:hypothetical protein
MNRDSRAAAALIAPVAEQTQSILVWGYRPDILVYTRLRLGTPYLDTQPLTGVLADRHLSETKPTFDGSSRRQALSNARPTFVVDGLGPYNPALAITRYRDLNWPLQETGRTAGTIVYRLNPPAAAAHPE